MRRMRPLMGTYVELCVEEGAASQALEAGFAAIEQAQAWWSFQDSGSELSRLNRSQGEAVPLRRATLALLRLARGLMQRSCQTFDCTVGGTLVAAGVLPDHGGLPPLMRGCAEDIELGQTWARLRRPVRLTLDGIAKGHAIDRAVTAMRRHGVRSGWVNAGGDLRSFGALALPVHRRELDGRLTPLGALRDAAVASSRAAFERDAAFPSMLVAPPGAEPARGIWTVLARQAWRADALTKVAATAEPARRASLVAALGGCLLLPELAA